jgi:hypothetical protein
MYLLDAAIDIAVERSFNSFAEHLNNLVYKTDDDQNNSEEEQDDQLLTSGLRMNDNAPSIDNVVSDDTDDPEPFLADYYASNEASGSTRTGGRMVRHSIPDTTDENIAGRTHINSDLNPGGYNPDAFMKQFGYMTLLAHEKSLSELKQERDSLKTELAMFCGEDNTYLAQKSVAELISMEEQVKRSLDRIIKAKDVASSNLDDARKCVICREKPKSVLFMDCRHLCVCTDCGHLHVLVHCPLGKEIIREKINVYTEN